MEGKKSDCSDNSFTSVMTLTKMRVPRVPQRYVLPPSQRPNPMLDLATTLPIIDISALHHPSLRSFTLDKIRSACKKLGFFQVVNHGIPISVMNDSLAAATEFFNLSLEEKIPLLYNEIEGGNQLMAINCYPACPEPDLTLGMPPHSDYGTLTILHQSGPGLQLQDNNKNWLSVPFVEGSFMVQLGDQIEVMSNGKYKSVVHQVTLSAENKRLSIASLHSLPLNKKIGPAPELVDEQHPASHKSNGSIIPLRSPAKLCFLRLLSWKEQNSIFFIYLTIVFDWIDSLTSGRSYSKLSFFFSLIANLNFCVVRTRSGTSQLFLR